MNLMPEACLLLYQCQKLEDCHLLHFRNLPHSENITDVNKTASFELLTNNVKGNLISKNMNQNIKNYRFGSTVHFSQQDKQLLGQMSLYQLSHNLQILPQFQHGIIHNDVRLTITKTCKQCEVFLGISMFFLKNFCILE